MNKSVARRIIILLVMTQFISVIIPQVLNISSVKAQASPTIRAIDSLTGLNNTALGNESEPFPADGLQFTLNFTLNGEASDLLSWNIGVTFDNDSVRCTRALVPQGDLSYVFYGKQGIAVSDLSGQDTLLHEVLVGGGLVNPADSVTVNNALLCVLNFTVLKTGDFTISFVQADTFILDSLDNEIPSDNSGFRCSGVGIETSGTIYIRADGSIDPPTAPIHTADNITYTLTGNITSVLHGIVIERDNVVVDGAGYVVTGSRVIGENGITLTERSNATVKNMTVNNYFWGIYLYSSSGNTLSGNNVANNEHGIWLDSASDNTLSGNVMGGNQYDFGVIGTALSDYLQSVDTSNLVDGKPVYYFVNRSDIVVNADAYPEVGYLGFVSCANVTVKGMSMTNIGNVLLLAYTTGSKITGNNIANNQQGILVKYSSNNTLSDNNITNSARDGIVLESSSDNTLSGNNIANGGLGIWLYSSSNNTLSSNNIADVGTGIKLYSSSGNTLSGNNVTANNHYGIYLGYSSGNTLSDNNLANNWDGILLDYSSGNSIFHNSFVNSTYSQVYSGGSNNNTWDNGYPSGGNYWSDYNRTDADHDGIGDAVYIIAVNNTDRYPLMGMFSEFDWVSLAAPEQRIQTICSSTISNLVYNGTAISFNVTGEDGTAGFCRICIPTILLNVTYKVFVNGTEVTYRLLSFSDETYSYLYFNYTHSTEQVIIIPESPSFLILPLFFTATLLAVIVRRRKIEISDVM